MDSVQPAAIFDLLWAPERGVKRGRRPSMSREKLVQAAIELADSEGIAAVTMQRLAELVNSKTMSLYRYVPSKDVLLDLMWDAAFAGAPKLGSEDWRSDLTGWAVAGFERLEEHPWMIELVGGARSVGPRWTSWLDAGLAAMVALPLNASEKLAVLMVIDGQLRSAARIRFGVKADPQWAVDFGRMLLLSATDDSYPTLGAMVRRGEFEMPGMSMEQTFDFGLRPDTGRHRGVLRAKVTPQECARVERGPRQRRRAWALGGRPLPSRAASYRILCSASAVSAAAATSTPQGETRRYRRALPVGLAACSRVRPGVAPAAPSGEAQVLLS